MLILALQGAYNKPLNDQLLTQLGPPLRCLVCAFPLRWHKQINTAPAR